MSQHDYVLDNATGANFRIDINNLAAAIVSRNSGLTEPSTTFAYMPWADTTAFLMKQRNAADDAWISIWSLTTGIPVNEVESVKHENYITDGDFLFNPQGTIANPLNQIYVLPFWKYQKLGAPTAVQTFSQDLTDRPTIAEANIRANASMKIDVTTAQAVVANADYNGISFYLIGQNYTRIAEQTVTLQFWVRSTITGIYSVAFKNIPYSGSGLTARNQVKTYTILASNTWEFKTLPLLLDTPAQWRFDNDAALEIRFTLMSGSDFHASTINTWLNNEETALADSSQVNLNSSTSNEFKMTLIRLHEGTNAPVFTRDQLSIIRKKLDWQFQRITTNPSSGVDEINDELIAMGRIISSTEARFYIPFDEMRIAASKNHPTSPSNRLIFSSSSGFTVKFFGLTGSAVLDIISGTAGRFGVEILATAPAGTFTGLEGGGVSLVRTNTEQPFIEIDSRFYLP